MRIVIASRLWFDVADRLADLVLGDRVERRGRLVEDEQVGIPEQRPRDRQPLALAAGDLHAAFADHRVEPLCARASRLSHAAACAARRGTSASVAPGLHEQQVLADGAGEQLRLLRDEPDPRAQPLEVHLRAGCPL